jgi:phosphonate transport system substrate-binding protein
VLATQRVPLEAIVSRSGADGEAVYAGSLAVRADSPIRTMDDLVRHSKELTISFVDPASASGFLVQNAFLQSKGIEPQKDFRKVMFTMSHPASILTLKAGKVDVAAVMERLVRGYLKSGQLKPGELRVLWTSPPIPTQPIAVSRDLPRDFIEEIRRAFLEMKDKDPETFSAQVPKSFAMLVGPRSDYVLANDAMFDGLREMARSVPNLSLLEH